MKKYKYSKSILISVGIACYLICLAVFVLADVLRGQPVEFDRPYYLASGVYLGAMLMGVGEYLHRSVEFKDNIICLNSVRAKSFRVGLKAMDYRLPYADVWRISADKLPLIGIYRIKVNGKNLPAEISINCCFSKHKQLFEDFYNICKSKNPNIKFDTCLVEFAENRNKNV